MAWLRPATSAGAGVKAAPQRRGARAGGGGWGEGEEGGRLGEGETATVAGAAVSGGDDGDG